MFVARDDDDLTREQRYRSSLWLAKITRVVLAKGIRQVTDRTSRFIDTSVGSNVKRPQNLVYRLGTLALQLSNQCFKVSYSFRFMNARKNLFQDSRSLLVLETI